MDLEELTKTQIVLLTLLITFVTSIATGIVTVTLMDQAPPAVTQTINRVVERTVERVVPAESTGNTVVKEKEITVVVKEDDLITDSIEKNRNRIVRLYINSNIATTGSELEGNLKVTETGVEETFLGFGVILTKEGLIATDRDTARTALSLKAVTSNGKVFSTKIVNTDSTFDTGLLAIVQNGPEPYIFSPATLSSDQIKLGQTVIALSGRERTNVAMGIISDLVYAEVIVEAASKKPEDATIVTKLVGIETNIVSRGIGGTPLLNIFGEVIAIKAPVSALPSGLFSPAVSLKAQIDLLNNSTAESIESTETSG